MGAEGGKTVDLGLQCLMGLLLRGLPPGRMILFHTGGFPVNCKGYWTLGSIGLFTVLYPNASPEPPNSLRFGHSLESLLVGAGVRHYR